MSDQNRVIKFRCWNATTKKMYQLESTTAEHNHYLQTGSGGFWLYRSDDGRLMANSEAGDVLMQFVGIQDKNGKDIYEGDIVVWGFTGNGIGEIKWDHKNFRFDISLISGRVPEGLKDYWSDRIEVIGNRHEHPSLLNPQTEK